MFFGIMALSILVPATLVFAASVGDTIEPLGHLKYAITGEYNRIIDKDLEGTVDNDATAGTFSSAEIEAANQLYVKLAMGLTEYFNIYTKLGMSDLDLTIKETDGTIYDIETEYGLLWGGGISGAKEIYEGWNIGADVQFLTWSADIDSVKYKGEAGTSVTGELDNYEFQTAIFGYKKFDVDDMSWIETVTPYLGLVYSHFISDDSTGNIRFNVASGSIIVGEDLEGDDEIGIVGGMNMDISDNVVSNVEVRFIDETALSGTLTYRF